MTTSIRPARPADARAIAQVRIDGWRTTYRGMVPDAYLDRMSVDENAAYWQRILEANSPAASVFVAMDDQTVVGFAAAHRREPAKLGFDGELSAIYLTADSRRRGLGRRLVAAVARAQQERGVRGLIVWVIAGNRGARAFYEALGGELLVEQPFQWDGLDLQEAGYGFRDLQTLAPRETADTAQ